LLLALALPGCSGDDGKDGRDGTDGVDGVAGDPGPSGDPLDPVVALEACIGCHGDGAAIPVGNITDVVDAHFIDTDPNGPQAASGYRQLNVAITVVSVVGASVVIDFDVTDENGSFVNDLFAGDGRFTLARLDPPPITGDPSDWINLLGPGRSERFTSNSSFQFLGTGSYRYTSNFDPTSVPVLAGDTLRLAIQLSAGDLPAGNGWCDFDADLTLPNNDCNSATLTRDIVQTATCNGCHGVTTDTKLALHGGGRTEIEYCVTCHNPDVIDPDTGNTVDFKVMAHKIHRGADLTNLPYQIIGFRGSVHDYSFVNFTKDIDDCAVCHQGGGADVANWNTVPNRDACGSCHDHVDFDTGANHPDPGGQQLDNSECRFCHPPASVQTVHRGAARRAEGSLYAGAADGYSIDDVVYDSSSDMLTVDFSVTRGGMPMLLESAPEWTAGGGASRLAVVVGWDTSDYDNAGSGRSPAQPLSVNGLDVDLGMGGVVEALGGGAYRTQIDLGATDASGTITVGLEGHPAADLDGDGTFSDRIAVRNAFAHFDVAGGRSTTLPRRQVIDIARCNQCHDAAGNGLSLHGNNRTGEEQVCVLCHNADATDINRRPADPAMTPDGKREETIHFRRMIHQIHSGGELQDGLFIYGFGGTLHDFSHVGFIGNRQNCETCHVPGTYGIESALDGLATTVDTGADVADPGDDLNISHAAAVCSSCHDDQAATDHMKLNGASFQALDADIF
jgi:OmcA/MtrC family decaheme c-type cytochrome